MSTTVSLSYENTFNVFDYVTQERIGEVCLMSDGWAAYCANSYGRVLRIGTYADAELAIRAVDDLNQNKKSRKGKSRA